MTRSDAPENTRNRRRFLKGIGAISVVGLAGCGGDDDTPAETTEPVESTEPGGTTESGGTTEPGETTEPTGTTEPGETTEPTGTADPGETTEPVETTDPGETTEPPTTEPENDIPDENPVNLLSFSDTPVIDTEGSTTISGTISNPYLFDLNSGEITIEAPSDGWEINPVSGTMFDTLESGASRTAEWEISPPESASAEVILTVSASYASSSDQAEHTFEQPIGVVAPPEVSVASVPMDDLGDEWQHAYAVQGSDQLTDEPAVSLPAEPAEETEGDWSPGPADVYFAWDADTFYYRLEITQEELVTVAGPDMYMADSAFFGTAVTGPALSTSSLDRNSPPDTWGPEYNMRHDSEADSGIELVQYQGEQNAPLDHTDMTATSTRDEETNTTTFDLEIPWGALKPEPPASGDTIPLGLSISDNETVDGETQYLGGWGFGDGAFGWPKFPAGLGRVTLQSDDAAPYEPDPKPEGPDQIESGQSGPWTITVVNWHDSSQEIDYDVQDTDVSGTLEIDAESAIQLGIEWVLVDSTDLRVEFDNGKQVWASERSVTVG